MNARLRICQAYIDDLSILTKDTWEHHLISLEQVFKHLFNAGLKVDSKKSFLVELNLNN